MRRKHLYGKLNILLASVLLPVLLCSCSLMPKESGVLENAGSSGGADTQVYQPTDPSDSLDASNASDSDDTGESMSAADDDTLPGGDKTGNGASQGEGSGEEKTEDKAQGKDNNGSAGKDGSGKQNGSGEKDGSEGAEEGLAPIYGTGLSDESMLYAYGLLSEDEKADYETILSSLVERKDNALITLDKKEADYIYNCVMADHPELFYIDGYTVTTHTRGDKLVSMTLSGNYSLDESSEKAYEEQMKPVIEECLAQAPADGDYDKIKYVYEYVIGSTDYSADAEHNQTIVSVFVNHSSVCNGYSKAVQYLLQRLGVETVFVTGAAKGSGHAWNMVKADGSWYYVDATWGDASYTGISTDNMWISYDYLCVTTQDILSSHAIGNTIKLPECTAREDNYYIRENAWFDSFDESRFALLSSNSESGDGVIRLRCGSRSVYEEMGESLITNKKIYDYVNGGSISYIQSDDMLTYTFMTVKEKLQG